MRENRFVCFDAFGQPEETLRLDAEAILPLGEGEVRVRLEAAPVNPADLNYIQGVYGEKPDLPGARAGLEGCGVVAESADPGFREGDRVILLSGVGSWARYLTAPASCFLKLKENMGPRQAAMLKVNPLTAYLALTQFVPLRPGDWIVQNAANSGVGQCVIQLAKLMGVHTVNFVRRCDERKEWLMGLGADLVLEEGSEQAASEAIRQTGGKRPCLACNAVGGESAQRLMDLLAPGGVMATYGAMSRKSVKVPNKWLIFKDITLKGLWCTLWLSRTPRGQVEAVYDYLSRCVAEGHLQQSIEKEYPLEEVRQAVLHAQGTGRNGKVLLDLDTGKEAN